MILQCRNCKSLRITKYSQAGYILKTLICLVVIVVGGLELLALINEKDVDRIVLLGLLGSSFFCLLGVIMGVYYLIKSIRTKGTGYLCGGCKSKLDPNEIIQIIGRDEEILLSQIRRKRSFK